MIKVRSISLILVLALISGSLGACAPPENSTLNGNENGLRRSSPSPVATGNTSADELNKSLSELKTAYEEFEKSRDEFLQNLEQAVDETSMRSSVNSKVASENLEKLRQASLGFSNNLQGLDDVTQEAVAVTSGEVNSTLEEISRVIDPLQNGLADATGLEEVQRYIGFFERQEIPARYYGNYGPATQKAVDDFLSSKTDELGSLISRIEVAIKPPDLAEIMNELNKLSQDFEALKTNQAEERKQWQEQIEQVKASISSVPVKPSGLEATLLENWFWILAIAAGFVGAILGDVVRRMLRPKRTPTPNTSGKRSNDSEDRSSPTDDALNEQFYTYFYNNLFKTLSQELSQKMASDRSQLSKLQNKLETLERNNRVNIGYNSPYRGVASQPSASRSGQTSQPPTTQQPQPASRTAGSSVPQFINTYNQNPKSLSRQATEVNATKQSMENRRLGSGQLPIMEKLRQGNYWIIQEGGHQYMVPKANLKINEYNYATVEALFDCHGYGPGSSFRVVEPAIVYPISSGQTWQVQKRGVLQFH